VRADELLRRYLEQRREMGERELVLDGLTVDEVMRLIGAGRAMPAPGARPGAAPGPPPAPPSERPASADWRAVLRGAGAGGEAAPAPAPEQPAAASVPPPSPGLVVGSDAHELFGGPLAACASVEAIAALVRECTRCELYRTATHAVPGEGNARASLMCVGEAPGASEDASGRPFVGQAGQLLTKILAAIKLSRDEVFIANVLKHRPPGNRNPRPEEVEACRPYLARQIELIRPRVIVAFGTFAAQTLLETKLAIGRLRGVVHRYHGIPVVVTYHPAALLRNPAWKRSTWEDVQLARRILDSA